MNMSLGIVFCDGLTTAREKYERQLEDTKKATRNVTKEIKALEEELNWFTFDFGKKSESRSAEAVGDPLLFPGTRFSDVDSSQSDLTRADTCSSCSTGGTAVSSESDASTEESDKKEGKDAKKGKLLYLSQLRASHEYIVDILVHHDAELKKQGWDDELSDEASKEHILFFNEARVLLQAVKECVEKAAAKPTTFFSQMLVQFKSVLTEHPKSCVGGVGLVSLLAGGIGYLYGAGTLGLNSNLMWVWDFGPQLAALFGSGTFAGAVITGLAVVGATSLVQYVHHFVSNPKTPQHEEMQALHKKIDRVRREMRLPLSELISLRECYERTYALPLMEPKDDDRCIICQDDFHGVDLDGCSKSSQVRAPGCQGQHYVHKQCLATWTAKSSSLRCTVCRQ